jgi:guanine deaminase
MPEIEKKLPVVVEPQAFVAMLLHAAVHSTTVVHGILLGRFTSEKVIVTKALPVCHEVPTKPLVETALSLAVAGGGDDQVVVGWYTSPERWNDTSPGPAALRIAAGLATSNGEPVLIVLNNECVAKCLRGDDTSTSTVLIGLGKDFGQQWLAPLSVSITNDSKAKTAAAAAYKDKEEIVQDLVDHWETFSGTWFTNDALSKHVAKFC